MLKKIIVFQKLWECGYTYIQDRVTLFWNTYDILYVPIIIVIVDPEFFEPILVARIKYIWFKTAHWMKNYLASFTEFCMCIKKMFWEVELEIPIISLFGVTCHLHTLQNVQLSPLSGRTALREKKCSTIFGQSNQENKIIVIKNK